MDDILKYFGKSEVKKATPVKFRIISKKKLVTFVPLSHVDKLTFDLANSGAGIIGNYSVCSFRIPGIGTFVPGNNSNPFTGKRGKLSFEEEIRLEMEFPENLIEEVIDTLLESHPYEEPAYEIYDFTKRGKTADTYFIELKRKMNLAEIMNKFNRKISVRTEINKLKFGRILLTERAINDSIFEIAKRHKVKLIISLDKNKINFKII